ncbi:MAG: hypothetical protein WA814_06110, partial [Candidatus Baltobacteraceae bacterium]
MVNLVVELNERSALSLAAARDVSASLPGIAIAPPGPADDRTLAWIDDEFGGSWSSETYAGQALVARRGDTPVGFAAIAPRGLAFAWLRGLAREPGVGIFGPIGVARSERKTGLG